MISKLKKNSARVLKGGIFLAFSETDFFLPGKESEAHLVNQLVFGTIESVMSCLDKDTLTLTLLHLVGSGEIFNAKYLNTNLRLQIFAPSWFQTAFRGLIHSNGPFIITNIPGMIRSAGDVGMFMKRTLLYIQQPNTCLDSAEGALRTLQVILIRSRVQCLMLSSFLLNGFQRELWNWFKALYRRGTFWQGRMVLSSLQLSVKLFIRVSCNFSTRHAGRTRTYARKIWKRSFVFPKSPLKVVSLGSLDPAIAGSVIQTLDEANKYLVLLGDQHLVYLSIPPINILE